MLNSTNSSTVGNFKLFVCLMTLPVQFVVALRYVLNAPVGLSDNIASLCTSSNLPRYMSAMLAMLGG